MTDNTTVPGAESAPLTQPWSDREHKAYELGMLTEREHQMALARLVDEKHAAQLAAKDAELDRLRAELVETKVRLSGTEAAWDEFEELMFGGDTDEQ